MYADKSKAEYRRAYAHWLRQMARHTNEDDRYKLLAIVDRFDTSSQLRRWRWVNARDQTQPRQPPILCLLERLLQSHRDHAAVQALGDVTSTLKTALGGNLVRVGCSLIRDVLHHQLDADIAQILVRGPVSGAVSQRQIERVVARHQVRIVRDQAGVRVARHPSNSSARRDAAKIDIGRSRLAVEEKIGRAHV